MKILAIRGKNLASLEGEFEIDFKAEPLRSAGIFAITGSTGSGKSTLLDALCLALFDDTPRNNRTAENISITDVKDRTINQKDSRNILRRGTSDGYAEVDFVSLGGETFRSRWGVRRSRDKIDGSLQSTDFKLINLSTNVEVQGRKTELLAKVVELIGLTFDQFTRAVLLAQGDFATFLKATQKEKAELLEKLTGTEIYSRISASIYEKSKSAEQDLNLLKERIKGIELLPEEALEALTAEKQSITKELVSLKTEVGGMTAKIEWINNEELLSRSVQEGEKRLEESQKAIEEAKPRYDYLAKIDSVQEIRDSFTELKNTQKQLADNKVNLTKLEAERESNALLLKQTTEQLLACEAAKKQQNEIAVGIAPQIRQARELDVRIVETKKNAEESKREYDQAMASKLQLEKSIKTTRATIETARQTVGKIAIWFTENSLYKEIIPRVDLIVNLLNDVETAKKQSKSNAETLAKAKEMLEADTYKLAELKEEAERLNKLLPAEIATLRAKLQDGSPCPVCGSLHHPMSSVQGESLEEEELNRTKKEVNNKITLLTDKMESLKAGNIRLQSLIDTYGTHERESISKLTDYLKELPSWQQQFEQGSLQNTLKTVASNWNKCTQAQTTANEHTAKAETTLQLEQKNLEELANSLKTKEQKLQINIAELTNQQKERASILEGRSADEVEKALHEKSKEIADRLAIQSGEKDKATAKNEKCLGVIAQLSSEIEKQTEQCHVLQRGVKDWIASQQGGITFELVSELVSKESSWLASEREALNRLRENKTSAQATLTERRTTFEKHLQAEVKPAEGETKETLQALFIEQNTFFEQKNSRHTEIDVLFANHENGKKRIESFEKELTDKSDLSNNWKKLNELFGSADGAKFKVLAQGYTLEALLTYANKHLQELSKRYELQRIPDTLALQVVDLDMLGEIRTVHSLSGGESFLISLALALGLSSLSSNRMNVESLFIDEGFGSLDIDTLRIAMDALERLQTQGRKIGVISHVAEMTERITTQVRVIKTSNGKSNLEVV